MAILGPRRPSFSFVSAKPSRTARSHIARGSISFVLLVALEAAVPANAQTEPTPEPHLFHGTDVSDIPVAGQPVDAAPVTDADRIPVPVQVDTNGLEDPAFTKLDPGPGNTLDALIGDEIAMPKDGGADFDAFAPEPGVGSHFFVLYPGLANEKTADGSWVALPDAITPTENGWEIGGETFKVGFPAAIDLGSPVSMTTGKATISSVPHGVVATKGELVDGAVTYPGALAATDLIYSLVPGGYKETVTLLTSEASGTIAWDISTSGLTLEEGVDGRIQVSDSTGVLFEMPAPVVSDDSGATTVPKFVLTEKDPGSYLISLTVDGGFLAKAIYPVTIDPGTTLPAFLYDTYADSSAPTTPHNSHNPLVTGPWTGSGAKYRTFFRFGTAWEDPDKVIYSAELHMKNTSEPNASTDLQIARATWDWSNFLTWNSMIGQPNEGVSTAPWVPDQGGPTNGWWILELKRLYQPIVENVYPDYGFRLVSTDNKKFSSVEASGTANDPYLLVSFDTLPNGPSVAGPTTSPAFESRSGVTLRLNAIPSDPDGDEVLVQYQVTNSQGNWGCGGNGQNCSTWTDEDTFNVPATWLTDGGTYWWRAQSADICTQPTTLCSNTRPDDSQKPWKTSNEFTFTISLKNRGVDSRYAMWSQEIGNGMRLHVNEANGNLVAQVPLASVRTPLGRLRVNLSYNSQAAAQGNADRGIGQGWRLSAGPESSGLKIPIEVSPLTPAPYAGVKVTFASGSSVTFPWRAGHVYGELGQDQGVITEGTSGRFVYRGPDGDVYHFDTSGQLSKARTVSTKPKVSLSLSANPNYRYTFNANNHLTKVKDPLDREINLGWQMVSGTERLKTIDTWSGDHWDLFYTTSGSLERVKNPELENVWFEYASVGGTSVDLLSEVRNGFQYSQHNLDPNKYGWRIQHFFDTVPVSAFQTQRVQKIAPPGANFNQKYWTFTYGAAPNDYIGSTSKTTKITDPRGWGQVVDWTAIVDFNNAGFPIRSIAPKSPGETSDWTTRMVWDTNNQLLCRRSPAANALNGTGCTASDTTGLQNSIWTYDVEAPFRLKKIQRPAPNLTTRVEETFTYDEGTAFNGLWSERFENGDLADVPADERSMTDLILDWGSSHPSQIDSSTWSMRLTGMLFMDPGETYEFKIDGDDGYSLVVDNTVLLDCLYVGNPGINCGNANPPKKKVYDPDHRVMIEYRDVASTNAHLKVYWRKKPSTTWVIIPASSMSPDLGLLTQRVAGPAGGGPLTQTTTWTFPNEDFKAIRLPQYQTISGGSGGQRQTKFDYDDWGRKSQVTRFSSAPSAEQAITTFEYTDNTTKSCLTRVVRPEGRERRFDCNADGERIQRKVTVRAVTIGGTTIQPLQTRTWDYTRDLMGRITRVDQPGTGPGATESTYDSSGRPTMTRVLMRGTGSVPDNWATTTFSYNDWPGLSSFHTMTETYPDPDLFAGPGPTSVTHTFDWAGNETSRTDVRNPSLLWLTGYDAQNRVNSTTSPDPDGAGSLLPLTTSATYMLTSAEYSVTTTDPAGAQAKTWMDVLGRTDHSQSGSVVPTWFAYDPVGNVTRVQTSAAAIGQPGTIFSWKENDYDAFGNPTVLREPALVGGSPVAQATTYAYHTHTGRLLSVDGPLPNSGPTPKKDVVEYTWDTAGRLATTKIWGTPSIDYVTTMTYDDADEQVRLASELSADGTKVQIRDYSYTFEGQLDTTTERHGASSPLGNVVFDYNYDLAGRLIQVDSPRWPQTNELVFAYDDLGQETARYRDTGSGQADRIDTTYLPDGLMNTTARSGGATYTFAYDALGRQSSITDGSNPTLWSYFGTSSESAKAGWLKSMTTPAGTTSYTYYATGDSGGSVGQLKTLTDPLSASATTYTYDGAARVASRTDPGGLTWNRTYESQTGRVDTQKISKTGSNPVRTFAWFDLGYDVTGNVTDRVEKLWRAGTTTDPATTTGDTGTGAWAYSYDSAGRMGTAQGPNSTGTQTTWTYTYDGQGNRLSEQVGSVLKTYLTDDQGWPLSMDSTATGGLEAVYEFDPDGGLIDVANTTVANDLSFAYDSWGDTDSAIAAGTTVDYTLDAFGRTTRRTQGSSVTDMSYSGASEDLAKTVEGSNTALYAYSPGGPVASKEGASQPEFFLRDLHGDVAGTIAMGASALTDTIWYSPFGERQVLPGGPATAPPLGYQGDWTDGNTGTVDMLTRDYLPSLGRFTTRDTLGGNPASPPSLNQFVYTSGSPITFSDPGGLVQTPNDGIAGELPEASPSPCQHDPECSTPNPVPPSSSSGGAGSSEPSESGSYFDQWEGHCYTGPYSRCESPPKDRSVGYLLCQMAGQGIAGAPGYVGRAVAGCLDTQRWYEGAQSHPVEFSFVMAGFVSLFGEAIAPLLARLLPSSAIGDRMADVVAKGEEGIARVGLPQNLERVRMAFGDIVRYRIPDHLSRINGVITRIGEVKNVAYQALTAQLRDYIAYAESRTIPFDLWVRSSTVLSGPLAQAILDGKVQLRIIPGI